MIVTNNFIQKNMEQISISFKAVNLLHSPVGKLPQVNGSYLSSRKLTQQQLINSLQQQRNKLNSLDIDCAKKRLAWEIKKKNRKEPSPALRRMSKKIKTQPGEQSSSPGHQLHVVKLSDQLSIKNKLKTNLEKNTKNVINLLNKSREDRKKNQSCIAASFASNDLSISVPKPLTSNRHKIRVNLCDINELQQSKQSNQTIKADKKTEHININSIGSERIKSKYLDPLSKRQSIINRWNQKQKDREQSKVKRYSKNNQRQKQKQTISSKKSEFRRWEHEQHINLQSLVQFQDQHFQKTEVDSTVLKYFH